MPFVARRPLDEGVRVIGARWLVAGCAVVAVGAGAVIAPQLLAVSPAATPSVVATPPTARVASASVSSVASGGPSASPAATGRPSVSATSAPAPSTRPSGAPKDTRKGAALGRPFTVDGVVVVSAKHRVSAGYRPKVTGSAALVPEAQAAFGRLAGAVRKQGLRLQVVSGYRSYASQRALYAGLQRRFGRAYATKYVAIPGTSEHQTGLAVDLRSPSGRGTSFDRTKEWRWLRAHAHEYGFVLRYPKGKTGLTGIGYEPWHWRYVGVSHARAVRALGADVTLEEYLHVA